MANTRNGVPAGWQWRDGRPRWIPSPTLRAAGWKGHDLKDAKGAFLARGASLDAAQAVVDAVKTWRGGGLVPAALARHAPPEAGETARVAAPVQDRRSIGYLLDHYMGDPAKGIPPSEEFKAIANQIDRRSKLNRLVDVLAGYAVKPLTPVKYPGNGSAEQRAAYAAAMARVKPELDRYAERRAQVLAMSIDVLEPPAFEDLPDLQEAQGPLYKAYWRLRNEVGANMAHGVLADGSAWLEWCVKRRALRQNWAKLVDRETPPGRIRPGTWDELGAMVWAAEHLGLHSIADSVILGVDLSWSQADRLALRWPQVDEAYRVKAARQKTGIKGDTPLLANLGRPRIDKIRARQAERFGANVQPTHVLVSELTGKPWSARYYREKYAEVRALAATRCPTVATLLDLDLRDTAITVAHDAGLSAPEIATRSLHSLKRIHDVLQKHYAQLGQEIADAGAKKLNDHLAAKGVAL